MGSGLVSQTIIKKIFVSVVIEFPRQVGAGEQHEILHSTSCGIGSTPTETIDIFYLRA